MGVSPLFFPRTEAEAEQAVEHLLHQSPREHGIARTRWRLQDVGRALRWLTDYTDAGIYKVLKRLGFSRKRALYFIRSPDPDYRAKWQRILQAYQEAWCNPEQVILLFQDEFTYYRKADLRQRWLRQGRTTRHPHTSGANTKARITATLNALTGQVLYLQRSTVGREALAQFYAMIRAAYPEATCIYLVQDNWPVHRHPEVWQAVEQHALTPLFLPTYASWLNPIEKLWRWLRQDVVHDHRHAEDFKSLRNQAALWLDQFEHGSHKLLHYVGILTEDELDLYPY